MTNPGTRPAAPIAVVLGTRPEIVKLAGVARGLRDRLRLVYTGQHYDEELCGSFFRGLRVPPPHVTLDGVGGTARGRQIGAMISALSDVFAAERPSVVIVQGDTNTTSAGAQAAHYLGVPVLHVEAGLRSHDRAMPEEINRQVVGVIADLHCAPTASAAANLRAEGVPDARIAVTGNTIVEAVAESLPDAAQAATSLRRHGLHRDHYILATIHRPENTDDPERLRSILVELARLGLPVLFPIHPRTAAAVARHGLTDLLARLRVIAPVDHATFLGLAAHARLLVSDSGGVQEECTVLKKPLIVVRNSTERPEAVDAGFAVLLKPGPDVSRVGRALIADRALPRTLAARPSPFGDGLASRRIVEMALAFAEHGGTALRAHTRPEATASATATENPSMEENPCINPKVPMVPLPPAPEGWPQPVAATPSF
ncbi:UDP-N-acetylglucosamine 2-epimerase (non-hydrolyzing) [Streptomycetaceae bacterium NBC_01309]